MRKWWKDVNRGIVLLIIAIIAVISYLIADTIHNNKEKKVLKEIAAQYTIDSAPLFTTPEDFDFFSWNGAYTDSLSEELYSRAKPLDHYYVDNETVRHQEIDKIQQFFMYYYNQQYCPVSCTKSPGNIEITQIYNGSATAVVKTVSKIEYISSDGSRGVDERNTTDTLQFLYTGGEWKLVQVSSDLYGGEDYYGL